MSKFQKSAWFNLGFLTIGSLFALLCFYWATGRIDKGFNYVNVILFLLMIYIIKVVYLPVIFISAVLTTQLIKSVAIIVQCALEEKDG